MEYIGNFASWIKQTWIDELLSSRGTARPKEGQQPNSPEMSEEYRKAIEAGYDPKAVYFYMFDKTNFSQEIVPPFVTGNYHWWITKMLPGQFMPVHVDPHTLYEKNSNRYWCPLQDWEPGHVFVYEDQVITKYKAGDVWRYSNSNALHGASNIGHTTRLVLQISTHD